MVSSKRMKLPKLHIFLQRDLKACHPAVKWAKKNNYGSSLTEYKRAYQECPKGSWLTWFYEVINKLTKTFVIEKGYSLGERSIISWRSPIYNHETFKYSYFYRPGTLNKNATIVRSKIPWKDFETMLKRVYSTGNF